MSGKTFGGQFKNDFFTSWHVGSSLWKLTKRPSNLWADKLTLDIFTFNTCPKAVDASVA